MELTIHEALQIAKENVESINDFMMRDSVNRLIAAFDWDNTKRRELREKALEVILDFDLTNRSQKPIYSYKRHYFMYYMYHHGIIKSKQAIGLMFSKNVGAVDTAIHRHNELVDDSLYIEVTAKLKKRLKKDFGF